MKIRVKLYGAIIEHELLNCEGTQIVGVVAVTRQM